MKSTVRILIADDHAMVRDGLSSYLNACEGLQVVAAVDSGIEAVNECLRIKPDVALVDVVMPGLNGIDATTQIRELCPAVQVILVSAYSEIDIVHRALRAGALGFVAKSSAARELERAIRAVMTGRRFLGGKITESLLDDYIHSRAKRSPLDHLSARERQILQHIAEGRSGVAIAQALSLSPKTIDTYRSRIMEKLRITDLPGLIKFAIKHGIISPD